MKCPSCGKENTGDSRFCAFCGGKLAAENNANNAVQGFENNYEKKPKKSKLPMIIAVIIAAVLLLVAGFFVLKFTVLDAFAQESRVKGGLTDFFTVNDDIAELEKSFRTSHGYIKPADVNIVLDEVGDYAKEKLDAGEIKDYAVTENESVWIQFTSGVEYIYVPQTEESKKTNDETKTEDSSQQGGSDESENNSSQEAQSHQAALRIFDKQSEEITEEKLKEISEQYKLELTDSEELTLEMIEEIGKDKLVVWYGDGGYSEKTSALLPTSVRLDEERLQNDPEYLKELGYYEEYLSGGIVCTNGGYIAVTSKFFESRTETFDGSVFYLGSASSGKDDVLAKALLDKKASAVLANTEAICQDYNLDMINSVLSGMWRANSERKYNSLGEALEKAKEKNGDFCCEDHPNTEVTIFGNGAEGFRFHDGKAEYVLSDDAASFMSSQGLLYIDNKYIYSDQKAIYIKNSANENSKEIVKKTNTGQIMSDGNVVYFTVDPNQNDQTTNYGSYEVYSVNIDGSNQVKLFKGSGRVNLITCYNNTLYYSDLSHIIKKYDLLSDKTTDVISGTGYSQSVAFGKKIYFEDGHGQVSAYDLENDSTEVIMKNANIISPNRNAQEDKLCFSTSTDDNWYIYTVDKNGDKSKSAKIPSKLTLSQGIISSDGSYALMMSNMDESDFDLYKVNLKSGDTEVIKGGAGGFKGKGSGLTCDQKNREEIYILGAGSNIQKFNGNGYNNYKVDGEYDPYSAWLVDRYVINREFKWC